MGADAEEFEGKKREKQHHALVFVPTHDGVVDPIVPTSIIRPGSPFCTSDWFGFRASLVIVSRYSLALVVRTQNISMNMVGLKLAGWLVIR